MAQLKSAIERVMSRVEIIPWSGCWIFMGGLSSGYGIVNMGRGITPERAHRISYRHFKGPIQDGLFVCHACDIRECVNPDHLFLGTKYDNIADMVSKGRNIRGERQPLAKLNDRIVRLIRDFSISGVSDSEQAAVLGVSVHTIQRVVRGSHWRHV